MKTFSLKQSQVSRSWYILDASETPLGRLSTEAAKLLIGKGKQTLTPHIDNGDYVIIINSKSLIVTGNKADKKIYYRHSGYPGGLHKRALKDQLQRSPEKIIEKAVRGMLPVNKLRAQRLKRLKIYEAEQHNHAGQNPVKVSLKREGKLTNDSQ